MLRPAKKNDFVSCLARLENQRPMKSERAKYAPMIVQSNDESVNIFL